MGTVDGAPARNPPMHGSKLKYVRCRCGHRYSYTLERDVYASYSGFALTQKIANAKAEKRAQAKLARLLEEGIEACPCPQCGALTPEMERKLLMDRWDHEPSCLRLILFGIVWGCLSWGAGMLALAKFTRNPTSLLEMLLGGAVWSGLSLLLLLFCFVSILGGIAGFVRGYEDQLVKAVPPRDPNRSPIIWSGGASAFFHWARNQYKPPADEFEEPGLLPPKLDLSPTQFDPSEILLTPDRIPTSPPAKIDPPPDSLLFEYDPYLGGFRLDLSPVERLDPISLCIGPLTVYLNEKGKIAAIESPSKAHYRLRLLGVQGQRLPVEGSYALNDNELRIGAFHLNQTPESICLWFGGEGVPPDPDWRPEDPMPGLKLWFSNQTINTDDPNLGKEGHTPLPLLAGIRLKLEHSVLQNGVGFVCFLPTTP